MNLQRAVYETLRPQAEECESCGQLTLELWYDEDRDIAVGDCCL